MRVTLVLVFMILAAHPTRHAAAADLASVVARLPALSGAAAQPVRSDWLIEPTGRRAVLYRGAHPHEIVLTNGLIRRAWRVLPNAATVAFDNLRTGESLLRSVRPEASVEIEGAAAAVGGLVGQQEHAYLRPEWLESMAADPAAFRCVGFESGPTRAPFAWKRSRYAEDRPWPPPGVSLALRFETTVGKLQGVMIDVHYEMYDGIPLLAKWLVVQNRSPRAIRLNRFTSEILAMVEYESAVEGEPLPPRSLHVESDYAFHGSNARGANVTARWLPDPLYKTQVNYALRTPALLECRPPLGPDATIEPGGAFESFRTFELAFDGTERERNALALRRMYRTIAPWVTENPILMHVRNADPDSVRRAIDQCADVGFEMVILSFGSGFRAENEDPAYLAGIRDLVEYGRKKGVELGGYSLLASRKISPQDDVINPKTGTTGGAIFGESPCLGSRWGAEYFRKLRNLIEATGLAVIEHDGSYPGDLCASTAHPGHRGLDDSQWTQWQAISSFYRWCRERGVYLNVPDWYFLNGSNKTAMGYREVNWSLPRERQILLARQNIFDDTWDKTPSMGWMFVPLVQYQGGGAAATLEPLREHLEHYGLHLLQNFGSGVQACYRGPRLFDSDETKAVVKKWVDFYRRHRAILDSDVIHLRRPDGRSLDAILHVNPALPERGLAMIFNPLDRDVIQTVTLPLYYTGLSGAASIAEWDGKPKTFRLDRRWEVQAQVAVPARGATALLIRAEGGGGSRR